MSDTFINLFRSKKTFDLLENDHKSFLLFSYICLSAARDFDPITELQEGECFISVTSTSKKCGLTVKEYRDAKLRLIKQNYIQEIFNPDWIKKEKEEQGKKNRVLEDFKKRATKRATKCCIVKILELDVYDINIISKGNQTGKRRASKGQHTIRKEVKEVEVKKERDPSFENFSEPMLEKIAFRTYVHLTQIEFDKLLSLHGKEILDQMLDVLNSYKGSSGKEYKSDYSAMDSGSWVLERVKQGQQNGRTKKPPVEGIVQKSGTPKFKGQRVLSVSGDTGNVH